MASKAAGIHQNNPTLPNGSLSLSLSFSLFSFSLSLSLSLSVTWTLVLGLVLADISLYLWSSVKYGLNLGLVSQAPQNLQILTSRDMASRCAEGLRACGRKPSRCGLWEGPEFLASYVRCNSCGLVRKERGWFRESSGHCHHRARYGCPGTVTVVKRAAPACFDAGEWEQRARLSCSCLCIRLGFFSYLKVVKRDYNYKSCWTVHRILLAP